MGLRSYRNSAFLRALVKRTRGVAPARSFGNSRAFNLESVSATDFEWACWNKCPRVCWVLGLFLGCGGASLVLIGFLLSGGAVWVGVQSSRMRLTSVQYLIGGGQG